MRYKDFSHAGKFLAEAVKERLSGNNDRLSEDTSLTFEDPVILAVVWGGVEIGYEVSKTSGIPLDILKPFKITAEDGSGKLIGAVAGSNEIYIDHEEAERLNTGKGYIEKQIAEKKAEIARLEDDYRRGLPSKRLTGRTLIITDDGIATGATMTAAIKTLRTANPKSVVVAAPVANPVSLEIIRQAADEVICLQAPEDFSSVEEFYEIFGETPPERIRELVFGKE